MDKVISFEPQVGKAQTGKTSGRFAVIIPNFLLKTQTRFITDFYICFLVQLFNLTEYK